MKGGNEDSKFHSVSISTELASGNEYADWVSKFHSVSISTAVNLINLQRHRHSKFHSVSISTKILLILPHLRHVL